MWIRNIKANNFKSLVEFEISDLGQFTCLIGLNGAGKSTFLQFVDFLGQLMRGDIDQWLWDRDWRASELKFKGQSKQVVDYSVQVYDGRFDWISWEGVFNPSLRRCTSETIHNVSTKQLLKVHEGHYTINDGKTLQAPHDFDRRRKIEFEYQGSILSQLREDSSIEGFLPFKHFLQNSRSLDLLSPAQMRKHPRESDGNLGMGGQFLSAYLYEIGPQRRKKISDNLSKVFQRLRSIDSRSLRSGWKQLEIVESLGDHNMHTEAKHINDGLLRLIAILAELDSNDQMVVLDEIENGINPELVEFVIRILTEAKAQVVVTTHSPMILNYLEDDVAKSSVFYLYKTSEGYTQAVPFFQLPSLAEKLKVMGPGEAFVDTNLFDLNDEIEAFGAI